MNVSHTVSRPLGVLVLAIVLLAGCAKTATTPKAEDAKSQPAQAKAEETTPAEEAKIQAALAKLSDADRPLAEAQKFCPIEKTRLGVMGKPARIEIDGQPVFLCCSGCAKEARAEPKKTLEQVAQFKKGK